MAKKQTSDGNFAIEANGSSHPLPDSNPTTSTVQPKPRRQRKPNPLPYSLHVIEIAPGIRSCCLKNDNTIVNIYFSANAEDWALMQPDTKFYVAMQKVFAGRSSASMLIARFHDAEDICLPHIDKSAKIIDTNIG